MGRKLEIIGNTLFWVCVISSIFVYPTSALFGGDIKSLNVTESAILSAASLIGIALEIAGYRIEKLTTDEH